MGNKKLMETTTNRGVFNRAYKLHLEQTGKIHCSRCKYHKNENEDYKRYFGTRQPNWKLVSKNPKQWMKKPIRIVTKTHYRFDGVFDSVEIKF
jgi:16S rRNA C967 or C1407 C5-methylase (RsmB/RsmF family)